MDFLYAVGGWFSGLGFYILIRWRTLRKSFKASDYSKFLQFFEAEWLKVTEPTFRHKYSYVYNSHIYGMCSVALGVISVLVGILIIGAMLYVDYWS